ncbi:MAG: metal-dependent hydrolase [Nitrososphaera sp.]|nr:metal-dependent hydrolase [Nitrososphaera sp.]
MKWFVANALAAFEDFGTGALIAGIVSILFGSEASIWFLMYGGIAALLPDFDLIIPILRRKIVGNHHLTIMHRPLFVVPLATVVSLVLGGHFFGVTTFLCVLWHYVHDSPECGGSGIAWLWPFSDTTLSLRGTQIPVKGHLSGHHDQWLKKWCQPSVVSVREITIGSIGVIMATLTMEPSLWWVGILLVTFVWVIVLTLWTATSREQQGRT